MQNYFKSGTWNAICQVCGKKVKADSIKKRWDGLLVCNEDWEIRHPQDFLRGIPDKQSVPFSSPEPTDTFIEHICTVPGLSGIAGYAQAACARPKAPLLY